MKSAGLVLSLPVIVSLGLTLNSAAPVIAQTSQSNATDSLPATPQQAVTTLSSSYANLQTIWDLCYKVKGECADLLSEGRNAPARKKWVDYYVSTLGQSLSDLQSHYNQMIFPADLGASVSKPWADASTSLASTQTAFTQLQGVSAQVKSPEDGKYPPLFWGPAQSVADGADKFDRSLVQVLGILDTSRDNALLTMAQTVPATTGGVTAVGAAGTGMEAAGGAVLKGGASKVAPKRGLSEVLDVAQRTRKSCFEFFGELERFNLLFANPPKGEPSNMFYGGAFTKEQVLTQYKYMPNLVFTSAPYVKLFSYRLPPRQSMLASYTSQIGKLLNLLESELNDINIPADKEQAAAGPWNAAKAQFVDARNQYMNLYTLVQSANDKRLQQNIAEDQTSLGAPAMQIYDDMEKLIVAVNDLRSIVPDN
jgi:hypothetical protein